MSAEYQKTPDDQDRVDLSTMFMRDGVQTVRNYLQEHPRTHIRIVMEVTGASDRSTTTIKGRNLKALVQFFPNRVDAKIVGSPEDVRNPAFDLANVITSGVEWVQREIQNGLNGAAGGN